jgi:rhomboid protease GluP
MANQQRTSQLCPGCRTLVSTQAAKCPHCGMSHPGALWQRMLVISGLRTADQCVKALFGLNIGMYVISLLLNLAATDFSLNPFTALSPSTNSLLLLGATGTVPIDRFHRWWTLISANYLHGSLLHIIFNLVALRQILPFVATEYGISRMVMLYSLTGILGFWVSYLAKVPLTIGASAALCGMIGSALYYGKSRGGIYGQAIFRQIGAWALSIFVIGLIIPGINNWAHGGGMVAGALLGWLLGYQDQRPEQPIHRILANICLLATLLILAWAVLSSVFYKLSVGNPTL